MTFENDAADTTCQAASLFTEFLMWRAALLLALLAFISFTQPSNAQKRFDLVVDIVQFKADSGKIRWEFHYSFPDTSLTYVAHGSTYVGEARFRRQLAPVVGDTIVDEWTASAASSELKPSHKTFLTGFRTVYIEPAQYSVSVHVHDLNDTVTRRTDQFVSQVAPIPQAPALSSILFVEPPAVPVASLPLQFIRNTVDAIPDPRRECIGEDASLNTYLEIYNIKSAGMDSFALQFEVLDAVKRSVFTQEKTMLATADALVDRSTFAVDVLPTGVYNLVVRLLHPEKRSILRERLERFYILNPAIPPEKEEFLSDEERFSRSEFSTLQGQRLDEWLEQSDILAVPQEMAIRKELTTEKAKQRYLYSFWKRRDPDTTTAVNERLVEFHADLKKAELLFLGATMVKPWKTDRGRVLLTYGWPTELNTSVQSVNEKPWEDWFYAGVQGGVHFYFVDRWENNTHTLVHTTIIGGPKEPNWYKRWVLKGSHDVNANRQNQDLFRR
ncbi:MAG: GWxTD domain-containing protein [Candidatus Kapabacteria bacterium]|nr:GWxTD domain-containing protein [Candidatus Kapabacteria bacterium]